MGALAAVSLFLDQDPTTCGRRRRRVARTDPVLWNLVRLPLGVITPEVWAQTEVVERTSRLRLVGARRVFAIGCVIVEAEDGTATQWTVHPIPPGVSMNELRVTGEARLLPADALHTNTRLPFDRGRPHLLVPERIGEVVVTIG